MHLFISDNRIVCWKHKVIQLGTYVISTNCVLWKYDFRSEIFYSTVLLFVIMFNFVQPSSKTNRMSQVKISRRAPMNIRCFIYRLFGASDGTLRRRCQLSWTCMVVVNENIRTFGYPDYCSKLGMKFPSLELQRPDSSHSVEKLLFGHILVGEW